MAAVTVNQEQFMPQLGMEVINCTIAGSGDTYESKNLSIIKAAIVQPNITTAVTDTWDVTFSGKTATIEAVGTTAFDCTLILFG